MKRIVFAAVAVFVAALQPGLAQDTAGTLATDDAVGEAREILLSGDATAGLAALTPYADAGNARAQNLLGAAYQNGLGAPMDATQALHYFNLAYEQGYPPAIYNLGVLYQNGMEGVPVDLERARQYYAEGSGLDYSPAHSAYGSVLIEGIGGAVDVPRGVRAIRRGAEMGDPAANTWLGRLLLDGTGMAVDVTAARRHYFVAALQGVPSAQYQYALMLEFGDGGPIDLQEAARYHALAVAQDYPLAALGYTWLVFDNPDAFPDQLRGLAYCYWFLDNGRREDVAEYGGVCFENEGRFSESQRTSAQKLSEQL